MTPTVHLRDLRDGYVQLVNHVANQGRPSSPRGLPILELEDFTFTVDDLEDCLPVGVGRDLNTLVAAVEALQLQAARSTPDLLVAVAPQFANYREPEGHFHGAYGTRIHVQVHDVLAKLEEDRDTRQAIVTLWDADLDNQANHRDYPCTIALGFRIRREQLNLSVLMRSNDVWLGTAYDVFQFTQLQWTVARQLGIEPGTYTHTAWSMHIYERDLPRIAKLHSSHRSREELPWAHPTGLPDLDLATDLLEHPEALRPNLALTPTERWYLDRLLQAHAKLRGDG